MCIAFDLRSESVLITGYVADFPQQRYAKYGLRYNCYRAGNIRSYARSEIPLSWETNSKIRWDL